MLVPFAIVLALTLTVARCATQSTMLRQQLFWILLQSAGTVGVMLTLGPLVKEIDAAQRLASGLIPTGAGVLTVLTWGVYALGVLAWVMLALSFLTIVRGPVSPRKSTRLTP